MVGTEAHETPETAPARQRAWWRRQGVERWMMIAGAVIVVAIAALAWTLNHNWPYRYAKVKPLLESVFAAQIDLKEYHRTYFPRPGFVAHGLTLRRNSSDPALPPLGTADTLIAESGWLDILTLRRHVDAVDVEKLHIVLPPAGSRERKEDFPEGSSGDFSGPSTTIRKLSVREAVLEIQRADNKPIVFAVNKLVLHNMVHGEPLRYTLDMANPKPAGHILAKGEFGPIQPKNLGNTAVNGTFRFEQAKLEDIGKLRGELTAEGTLTKTLDAIAADVNADVPRFAVGDGRPIPVKAHVQCTIDGLNGDVVLNAVDGTMGSTPVHMEGSITSPEKGKPKVAKIRLRVPHGRSQDLMQPFMHTRPPIVGPVSLHAEATILPGKGEDFLKRLHMDGSFDVPQDRLTNKTTEEKLSAFSERAQGGKETAQQAAQNGDADSLSSMGGPFTLRDGVVSTERMHFAMAGASTDLHGTYSFRSKQVHLTGNLTMEADISHASTGWKSDLMKPFAIFFKHKDKQNPAAPAQTVFPIAITGGPGAYRVSGNLLHTK